MILERLGVLYNTFQFVMAHEVLEEERKAQPKMSEKPLSSSLLNEGMWQGLKLC